MLTDERELSESPRRRARELVLQALYAVELGEDDPQEVAGRIIADETLRAKNLQFARTLFTKVRENTSWADQQITALAKNWAIDRFAEIDRLILRMALTEVKEMPDIPVKVVINEAIELAKKYSTRESSGFINGILDSFVKKTETPEEGNGE